MEQNLFPQKQLRDHRGRFCNKEQKKVDLALGENKKLRYERDKYFRSYMALAERNAALERELYMLKSKIKSLLI